MKRKAILYLRVSTDEQADKGYSLQHQEERLNRYCALHDISIITTYKEDHSAKTFDRPEFKRLLNFCKKNHKQVDLILFINWSRFSRNAGDSYAMINHFQKLNIDPQAIEQPLDLTIPENKMMLAFYLAAPEVENDRRSMNVTSGMRRAKKEGRWVATAPMGYINYRDEKGRAHIKPGPKADLVREAFHEYARGIFTMEELRLKLNKKGLDCSRNQFSKLLRNRAYMGKILVPASKDENAYYVDALHEPLVSTSTFYKVQEVLDQKRNNVPKSFTRRVDLPLRGYLVCKRCGNKLTGSASKGNGGKYFYYHCKCGCKERFRADEANDSFTKVIKSFKAKPEALKLFHEILNDLFSSHQKNKLRTIRSLKAEIDKNKTRIRNAQKLMLDGDITLEEYKDIKSDCEKTDEKLVVQLSNLTTEENDYREQLNFSLKLLKDIDKHFEQSDLEIKQLIIGSIFPENLVYEDSKFRTNRINEVLSLICLNNRRLEVNKKGLKRKKSLQSSNVNPERFELPTS